MPYSIYIITGLLFLVVTLLIGWYISGFGVAPQTQIRVGLTSILASFLAGTVALIIALLF